MSRKTNDKPPRNGAEWIATWPGSINVAEGRRMRPKPNVNDEVRVVLTRELRDRVVEIWADRPCMDDDETAPVCCFCAGPCTIDVDDADEFFLRCRHCGRNSALEFKPNGEQKVRVT